MSFKTVSKMGSRTTATGQANRTVRSENKDMNDQLLVKSVAPSKSFDWLKRLETEELVEFFAQLLTLVTQISKKKKDAAELSTFLAEWRETALLNLEPEVLKDIAEAERELDAGGGKAWSSIKEEIGL